MIFISGFILGFVMQYMIAYDVIKTTRDYIYESDIYENNIAVLTGMQALKDSLDCAKAAGLSTPAGQKYMKALEKYEKVTPHSDWNCSCDDTLFYWFGYKPYL